MASADITDIQPAEYRADLVIQLNDDTPVLWVIVEVQCSLDDDKKFSWPAYVANLRARVRCPVCLLVVATGDVVARWAARPIEWGGQNLFVPYVLGSALAPKITDEATALANPELAVLSAIAHGQGMNAEESAGIAVCNDGLDPLRDSESTSR